MFNKFYLNLPPQINFVFLKNINENYLIYLYNQKFKIIFIQNNKNQIKFENETNCLIFYKKKLNKNNIKYLNFLKNFLKNLDIYSFIKIKFKGKGYRIRFYKKNKILKFHFGKSHITYFFLKNIILKKINKYKFLIKSNNKLLINNIAQNIIKIKSINLYTLRGLRLSRQIIYKRKGKKGSFI